MGLPLTAKRVMKALLRPFWVLLALIFLLEAWLWDRLEPLVAGVVCRQRWCLLCSRCPSSSCCR
jgi:hypothetical protein